MQRCFNTRESMCRRASFFRYAVCSQVTNAVIVNRRIVATLRYVTDRSSLFLKVHARTYSSLFEFGLEQTVQASVFLFLTTRPYLRDATDVIRD